MVSDNHNKFPYMEICLLNIGLLISKLLSTFKGRNEKWENILPNYHSVCQMAKNSRHLTDNFLFVQIWSRRRRRCLLTFCPSALACLVSRNIHLIESNQDLNFSLRIQIQMKCFLFKVEAPGGDIGSFHLYLFNFPFIYQFYSRMAILVE